MAQRQLAAYFERVPCYGEYNARFFRLPFADLAAMIVGELLRAGAISEHGGTLAPA